MHAFLRSYSSAPLENTRFHAYYWSCKSSTVVPAGLEVLPKARRLPNISPPPLSPGEIKFVKAIIAALRLDVKLHHGVGFVYSMAYGQPTVESFCRFLHSLRLHLGFELEDWFGSKDCFFDVGCGLFLPSLLAMALVGCIGLGVEYEYLRYEVACKRVLAIGRKYGFWRGGLAHLDAFSLDYKEGLPFRVTCLWIYDPEFIVHLCVHTLRVAKNSKHVRCVMSTRDDLVKELLPEFTCLFSFRMPMTGHIFFVISLYFH
jgi:hypothetical protein